jgi:uncharacterized protein YutE (UPF0331/DUF86 family)
MVTKVGRMTKIDQEIINTRIRLIIKYLNRLKLFESVSLDNYLNDFDLQLISERLLQLIVEVGTDINTYLLVELYENTPTTYFDSFIKAGQRGIITRDLAAQLAQSAGMRNRLVHQYEDIDNKIVFAAIPKALQQYRLYIQQITAYLDSLEGENA